MVAMSIIGLDCVLGGAGTIFWMYQTGSHGAGTKQGGQQTVFVGERRTVVSLLMNVRNI